MYEIGIWCDHTEIRHTIEEMIQEYDDFRIISEKRNCDVLIIDISQPEYALNRITGILEKLNGKTILIMIAEDSSQLLDIMGLYVYQYIVHEQLVERLPSTLKSIHTYLMNISTICVHNRIGKQYIKVSEIYALTYEEGFVYLYLNDKKIATQFTTLESMGRLLSEEFIQVNRHTIVHLNRIDLILKDHIILSNGRKYEVSRRRRKQLHVKWEERRHCL